VYINRPLHPGTVGQAIQHLLDDQILIAGRACISARDLSLTASVVQLCTHFIDEATNSPALADGLAHGITGQTTNNDDYENKCELELLWMAADLAGKISSHKSSSKLNLK